MHWNNGNAVETVAFKNMEMRGQELALLSLRNSRPSGPENHEAHSHPVAVCFISLAYFLGMWACLMGEEREEFEKQEWGKDECV